VSGWLLTLTIRMVQCQHKGSGKGGHHRRQGGHGQRAGAKALPASTSSGLPTQQEFLSESWHLDSSPLSPPYQSYQSKAMNPPRMCLLLYQWGA
jgi:hypothetical protein